MKRTRKSAEKREQVTRWNALTTYTSLLKCSQSKDLGLHTLKYHSETCQFEPYA